MAEQIEESKQLLASYLTDGGYYTEGQNVREGIDLESYEDRLELIAWMMTHHGPRSTQTAAVDVQAIEAVIAEIRRCAGNNNAEFHRTWANKLAAAITFGGE